MRNNDILDASRANPLQGGASFTLANRLYRAAFQLAWLLLARWTLPQFYGWRRLILRVFGARIAPGARIYPSARIWSPAKLEVGEHACIGPGANVYSMAQITLGPYAIVSQGAELCAGTHDIEDVNFQLQAAPIEIGAHAWVAAQAFVGPGVRVGEGTVLGARGCAFRHLEPWMVYVGNPAKPVKARQVRFPDRKDGGIRPVEAV